MPQIIEEQSEAAVLTEEIEYSVSAPFDHTVEYSEEYYERYIESFEQNNRKRYFYRFVKRAFDIVASLIMMLLLLPVFAIIAIAIKCDSEGPVIFKQLRIGKNGKPFRCLKFRSMSIKAPHDCATYLLRDARSYYTKVGKILRKTSLDELPQLWCVFIGKMSFIGYRPLIVDEECNEMRARLGVFSMRPGISGYAQVNGRDDLSYKNKAILDAIYVKNASLLFDIKLCFKTVAVVLNRTGNDANKKKVQEEKKAQEEATV
jgi:O-antigen biosynthesis protein WbqP